MPRARRARRGNEVASRLACTSHRLRALERRRLGRALACPHRRSPRCTSRWLFGVEQYEADGDLAGSFVAYVLGFVESDMRMTVRFANDIDATRILAEERSQLSNALLARTAGDRDAVHFELNFEMGFGRDFD